MSDKPDDLPGEAEPQRTEKKTGQATAAGAEPKTTAGGQQQAGSTIPADEKEDTRQTSNPPKPLTIVRHHIDR